MPESGAICGLQRHHHSKALCLRKGIQLFRLGLFQQGREQEALGLLELMEFDGKEELMARLVASSGLRQQLQELGRYRALAQALLRRYRPDLLGEPGAAPNGVPGEAAGLAGGKEEGRSSMERVSSAADPTEPARAQAVTAALP